MNQIVRNWPAFLILLGGCLAAWGSWVSSKRNDKQQSEIQSLGQTNIELGKINEAIGTQNSKITNENLELTNKTKILTQNIEVLTIKVNELLNKVHDEITGANSIPVVRANLRFNPHDHYARGLKLETPELYDKWLLDFTIYNEGQYPLTNIRISWKVTKVLEVSEDTELPTVSFLYPGESKVVVLPFVVDHPDQDRFYEITIKWKDEVYTYRVAIGRKEVFNSEAQRPKIAYAIADHYEYKEKYGLNITTLKEAILTNDSKSK